MHQRARGACSQDNQILQQVGVLLFAGDCNGWLACLYIRLSSSSLYFIPNLNIWKLLCERMILLIRPIVLEGCQFVIVEGAGVHADSNASALPPHLPATPWEPWVLLLWFMCLAFQWVRCCSGGWDHKNKITAAGISLSIRNTHLIWFDCIVLYSITYYRICWVLFWSVLSSI